MTLNKKNQNNGYPSGREKNIGRGQGGKTDFLTYFVSMFDFGAM